MSKQQNKKSENEDKKYKWLTIFNSTRCDLKISKQKEKRLREIIKEIKELSKEMENLFKDEPK